MRLKWIAIPAAFSRWLQVAVFCHRYFLWRMHALPFCLISDDFNILPITCIRLRLKAPWYIRLGSVKDFGRLVCALERMPLPAFLLRLGDSDVFAVQLDIIEERAVIYYAPVEKEGGQYLAYRVSNGVEEVFPSDGVGNATFSYS